jgi:hypothetical protein
VDTIRIGCKRDARKALLGSLDPVMAGGTRASGCSRAAYLSPDRTVVYKVCHDSQWDEDNRIEAKAVAKARTSPTGEEFVAPTTMWVIDGIAVNAQPAMVTLGRTFVNTCHDGSKHGWQGNVIIECDACRKEADVLSAAEELHIGDMHGWNWMVDASGRPWIIDANMAWRSWE